jgi:hypothetical protein
MSGDAYQLYPKNPSATLQPSVAVQPSPTNTEARESGPNAHLCSVHQILNNACAAGRVRDCGERRVPFTGGPTIPKDA